METENFKKAREIFQNAIEIGDRTKREQYLESTCEGDEILQAEVENLLKAHKEAGSFLEVLAFDPNITLDKSPLVEKSGTVIGRYKLLEKIGEGGMAVVYMAEQEKPIRRKVALKIIKLGMDTKSVIARFEAERQALAMMDHPNIAKVLDAGATETGRPYFVMELVTGVSIAEYCDKNSLSTKERLALFIQVCNAVQHAHQKGIIHRDIKPTNVMVTRHEGKPIPKVIDFGIAKATNQRLTEKTLFTRYAHIIGTPAYMSPEQADLSDFDIDTRSDIYSLGVLLYELLTGTTPFSEEELHKVGYIEMQQVIREQEPTKPSTKLSTLGETLTDIAKHRGCTPDLLRKAVRGDLDWVVMKALDKDRTRRYETANEFGQDIGRYLDDEPVIAGPPSTIYHVRKFTRRHRVGVAAGLSLAASLVMGFSLAMTGFVQASQEQTRTKAALQRAGVNFTMASEAIDEMTRVAKEQMAGVPGMEQVQRDLLQKAQIFYERFLQENRGDIGVREEIGRAYRELGDIYKMLGQYGQAEQTCRKSIHIFQELISDFPNVPEYRTDLAYSHTGLADALKHTGQAEEAEHAYRQAVEILEELAVEFPGEPLYRERAETYYSLGMLLKDAGQPEQVKYVLDQASYLLGSVVSDFSGEPIDQGGAYTRLGEVLADTGKLEEAIQAFQQAIELLEPLVADFPDQPNYQEDLAVSYDALGNVLTATDRFEEAEQAYLRAMELIENLVTNFPDNPHYQGGLAGCLVQLGNMFSRTGRIEEAEQFYREGIEIQEKVVADFPAMHDYRMSLAHQREELTELLRKTGRLEEAEQNARKTIELLEELAAGFPDVLVYQRYFTYYHVQLGNVLRKAGRLDEAEQAYQEALLVSEAAVGLAPDNSDLWSGRGDIYTKMEKWDEAIANFSMAIELDPNSSEHWHERAEIYANTHQWNQASADYSKAIELASTDTADPKSRKRLAQMYRRLGDVLEKMNRLDKAREAFQKAEEFKKQEKM